MTHRVFNFNAGPSTIPLDVLEKAQAEFLDYHGTGMSIMESSHRSPEYDEVNEQAIALVHELFGIGDDYHVIFMTGGASQQFFQIPMNFLAAGGTGAYIDTGTWSTKAITEAGIVGKAHVAFAGKDVEYKHIPTDDELDIPADAKYVHVTTNNTIKGTQFHREVDSKGLPLIADMSSEIGSMPRDFTKYSMFYAGAQKNLGPSGVTLVCMRDEMLSKSNAELPTLLNYQTQAGKKSLYNTPPSFSVYMLRLVLDWVKSNGGIEGVGKLNAAKKDLVYGMIDNNPDYYRGAVEKDARSWMNLCFRLPTEDLEKKFIAESKEAGLVGLKGHRSVGGCRASMYNAMSLEGAQAVAKFMTEFMANNG